jgi:endonuclease YncB( thermonuclease family)
MGRSMKLGVFTALLLLLWSNVESVAAVSAQQLAPVAVTIVRIEDGESLTIKFGSAQKALHLDGVQVAPCMADEAANRLYGLAVGRAALLDYDRASYAATGELAGYAWVDGIMLNLVLVSEGYAIRGVGSSNAEYNRQSAQAERAAQTQGLGLWSRCP